MSATETVLKASYDFDTETCGLYLGMHRICLVHPHMNHLLYAEGHTRAVATKNGQRRMLHDIELIVIHPLHDADENFVQIVVTTHKKD